MWSSAMQRNLDRSSREANGYVWVFGGSTADLGYVIWVNVTVTGTARSTAANRGYRQPRSRTSRHLRESCRR